MASFLSGGQPLIEIKINGIDTRKHITIKDKDGKSTKYPLFLEGDDISGTVDVQIGKGKKLEH